ncbi:uridine kinase [Alkaliphilus metalliredigens QYMF]|uniref:Uridine kinase n=1 Tax=Alkaliphilus metalliredigens (strain QYMF) TaxID=293826 RepID=URK_ALKMQ|nr:uridine kinase [Alkaliphilus metalliredigens]A6TR08.1 RecName: Full=Uridine kinase; AltName: Full=Cytidine monophosphokinase; AltName: Full=Uridine monophosphokinase [Alkaliphilus metalliredigens QYMF]ABR48626.1 uridine kinase [Alkaliphilus metalliredigens QYMF]
MNRPIFIGITGGTGSGKSTVARAIFESLPEKNIAIIEQDSYYRDQSHLALEERVKTNYDHPLAFDTALLTEHLMLLAQNKTIEKPIYDFERHTRKKEFEVIEPRDIMILEGIMILDDPALRDMLDIKIFVDTDADVRIIRRIRRDMEERGRTLTSVIQQYLTTVRPAHLQFVEPNKRYANIIIPEGGDNQVAIDIMVAKIKTIIQERS